MSTILLIAVVALLIFGTHHHRAQSRFAQSRYAGNMPAPKFIRRL
jgi:hypothetical protein